MPSATVYYWKSIKTLTDLEIGAISRSEDEIQALLPNRDRFLRDYVHVASIAVPDGDVSTPVGVADWVFHEMNVQPERHFRKAAYAEMAQPHTSMSVGDLVIVGEVALVTMPVGFRQVSLS